VTHVVHAAAITPDAAREQAQSDLVGDGNLGGTVNVLEALRADYVRTARAKGLAEHTVILRHVLKNALIPLITVLGPQIPNLATGSIFIEATFRIPGLGRYFVTSTWNRDYPMIMATMLLVAFLWGITYLLSDILYTVVDPRVRLGGERSL